jgi:hypothetical protein
MCPEPQCDTRARQARARYASLSLVAALLVGLFAPGPATAKPPRDEAWVHPDIAAHRIREIAVLPIVNVVDDARAPAYVEERIGLQFCDHTPQLWILPSDARKMLERATHQPYSLLDTLSSQIWREGVVDRVQARDVARQLGVESVLCVRINQWERRVDYTPHNMRAFVVMQAAVVDSAGSVLWTISGENWATTSHEQQVALAEANIPPRSGEWGVTMLSAYRRSAPDFNQAVSGMLERWAKSFPIRR